jgi:hypothetical protein
MNYEQWATLAESIGCMQHLYFSFSEHRLVRLSRGPHCGSLLGPEPGSDGGAARYNPGAESPV